MISQIENLIPIATLISHIVFVGVVILIISKSSLGVKIKEFLISKGLIIGLIVSLTIVLGSLFYSEVLLYEPCVLCWWQRVFLYPSLFIFALALWKKDRSIFPYVLTLASISAVIALYQVYANFGGFSLFECTATGGACDKVFVKEFGYITIPMMSLTASIYLIFISLINRKNG